MSKIAVIAGVSIGIWLKLAKIHAAYGDDLVLVAKDMTLNF